MWFGGRSVAPLKLVVPEWQVLHSPVATCAVPSAFFAGRTTTGGEPTKLLPASWQVEQAVELTTLCTIEGGAVPDLFAKRNVEKFDGA